jgi:hypothetical protein
VRPEDRVEDVYGPGFHGLKLEHGVMVDMHEPIAVAAPQLVARWPRRCRLRPPNERSYAGLSRDLSGAKRFTLWDTLGEPPTVCADAP